MATKKQRRISEVKSKKKKHYMRTVLLFTIMTTIIGLLIFLFVTLFDTLFPPAGKSAAAKKDKKEVSLFFSDANERFLVVEKRFVPKEENEEDQAKEIIKALIEGSRTGKVATFPPKAEMQSVKIKDAGLAEVSFTKSLIKNHPGGSASEMATIFSLTDTLVTNIPGIKKVKFLVEGKELASIKGHIDTRQAFEFKDMKVPGSK
jgi:hypothetical protein